jgi:hypothetical protein
VICGEEEGVGDIWGEMFEGEVKAVDWTRTTGCGALTLVVCCLLVLLTDVLIVGDMAVERDRQQSSSFKLDNFKQRIGKES